MLNWKMLSFLSKSFLVQYVFGGNECNLSLTLFKRPFPQHQGFQNEWIFWFVLCIPSLNSIDVSAHFVCRVVYKPYGVCPASGKMSQNSLYLLFFSSYVYCFLLYWLNTYHNCGVHIEQIWLTMLVFILNLACL